MTAWLRQNCNCIFVDAEEVCRPFGSTKFFNIILLGIAAGSGNLGIGAETLRRQIERNVPARFLEQNLAAFRAGYEYK